MKVSIFFCMIFAFTVAAAPVKIEYLSKSSSTVKKIIKAKFIDKKSYDAPDSFYHGWTQGVSIEITASVVFHDNYDNPKKLVVDAGLDIDSEEKVDRIFKPKFRYINDNPMLAFEGMIVTGSFPKVKDVIFKIPLEIGSLSYTDSDRKVSVVLNGEYEEGGQVIHLLEFSYNKKKHSFSNVLVSKEIKPYE